MGTAREQAMGTRAVNGWQVWLWVLLLSGPALAGKGLEMETRREALSLNGTWQCLRDQEQAEPWRAEAALEGWQDAEVPGPLLKSPTPKEQEAVKCVWAKRSFVVSKEQAGRGAVLKWNGIRFGPTVWINGKQVAVHPAIGPATYLLPAGLLKEGENQIVVKTLGWGGVPKNRFGFPVFPTGASTQTWGSKMAAIFDDIWIEFYDRAYMKWLLAMPDLAGRKVTLRAWFDAVDPLPELMEVETTVLAQDHSGKPATARVTLKGITKGKAVDIEVPLGEVLAWTPQTPHLYTVKIQATADGKACDLAEFRFGMRQIMVEDGRYRLNGQPYALRGSNMVNEWHWGPSYTQNAKRYLVDEARLMNLGCFRTHTQPPITGWCDVADENGMFFLAEMPVLFNFTNFRFKPEDWEQWHASALLDATGWVTKLWNHPSVFTWVLSNESTRDDEWESGAYYRYVAELDPTRPAMRSAGTQGTPKTMDVHTCGNIARGPEGWAVQSLIEEAAQRDPNRTLGNSEYMNYTGEAQSLRWFGQEGLKEQAQLHYAQLCLEHTEAMRRLRFDLILPYMYAGWTSFAREPRMRTWREPYPTPMAASLHSCMGPVLASLDLFDANYVAGSSVETPLAWINELHQDVTARVELIVTPHNPLFLPDETAESTAVSRQVLERTLKADSLETQTVRWEVPKDPGVYYIAAILRREGDRPVVSQRQIRAVAEPKAAARLKGRKLLVLGADEVGLKWLKDNGAKVTTEVAEDGIEAETVVVWDAAGLSARQRGAITPALVQYIEAGGRLVVLDHMQWDWWDLADLRVTTMGSAKDSPSSRAQVCAGAESDALMAGLMPQTLWRWNGLPGAVAGSYLAEEPKGAKPILWAEEPKKIVAMRADQGKGEVVVCLLRAKQRLAGNRFDPAAVHMMLNLLVPEK